MSFSSTISRVLGSYHNTQWTETESQAVEAVQEFPVPTHVSQVCQFLGLTSYYRRFIKGFAEIASPLHSLTKKNAEFVWSEECQLVFDSLKQKLTTAPVLVYPNFNQSFVLETDTSIKGLGTVLSQRQDDQLHPVAFASRALSAEEKNYSITELETLTVVWAIQHYHAYLYGHKVMVITDHSAVKAIFQTPSPSGKLAQWWLKVFASGVGKCRWYTVQVVRMYELTLTQSCYYSCWPQWPSPTCAS